MVVAVLVGMFGIMFLALVIDGLPKQDRQYGTRARGGPERPGICEHPHGVTHMRGSVDPPRVNGLPGGYWGMGEQCRHRR